MVFQSARPHILKGKRIWEKCLPSYSKNQSHIGLLRRFAVSNTRHENVFKKKFSLKSFGRSSHIPSAYTTVGAGGGVALLGPPDASFFRFCKVSNQGRRRHCIIRGFNVRNAFVRRSHRRSHELRRASMSDEESRLASAQDRPSSTPTTLRMRRAGTRARCTRAHVTATDRRRAPTSTRRVRPIGCSMAACRANSALPRMAARRGGWCWSARVCRMWPGLGDEEGWGRVWEGLEVREYVP